jgi:hypothetical protein
VELFHVTLDSERNVATRVAKYATRILAVIRRRDDGVVLGLVARGQTWRVSAADRLHVIYEDKTFTHIA